MTITTAIQLILSLATTLFILSLTTAHLLTPFPIKRIGQRPQGRGLWSYFLNQCISFRTSSGVWGYDSSLGSFSPLWRVSFHICGIMYLWAFISFVGHVVLKLDLRLGLDWIGDHLGQIMLGLGLGLGLHQDDATLLSYLIVSIICYSTYYWILYNCFPGVSSPGGPREHKIPDAPKWDNVTTNIDVNDTTDGNQWRCAVAQDSHSATLKSLNESDTFSDNVVVGLTGEPFGRQMWTRMPYSGTNLNGSKRITRKNQDLIEEMARAGRKGFNPSVNPNSADLPFREQMIAEYVRNGGTLPDLKDAPTTVHDAMKRAVHFYSMLQTEDGHWAGDYGGPHFLMPGMIITWYVMGKPNEMLDEDSCALMSHYLEVHQQSDGGWGTHIESPSTMFGTVLCYVALRLLGQVDEDSEGMVKARAFIQKHGGAVMTSSWAKFWLCILGCMEWEGHNSVPAEMWLLPNWFPFHPGRLWCHCRMVYLPMGYLYGSRFVYDRVETDEVIQELRKELYCEPYDSIPWIKTRHMVAPMDNYSPIPWSMALIQNVLARYETWGIFQPFKNYVRKFGLKFCVDYMAAEDLQTNYIDIGPVNKTMNMLSAYHAANRDINHHTVQNHMMRASDYLWIAEDGMKMQGYNGSQCWDTSFAIQAITECNLVEEFSDMSKQVWSYLERTQILSTETSQSSPAYLYESHENRNRYYRHVSKGGWPFSTSAHGWPISDCTGEGLKGVLVLLRSPMILESIKEGTLKDIEVTRLQDAINVILTLQNEDGGWATYENNRGFRWYEALNPSEVFGDIMIDYSYVECSMASLTALYDFHKMYPNIRSDEIEYSIQLGREFMKSIQREDGSWYGSWACCFCYGCWFGVEGLVKSGEPPNSPSIQKCCEFLLAHQNPNGGWGEDFTSCYNKEYASKGMECYGDEEGSGVVNTAWALLALAAAEHSNVEAIKRGVRYLMGRQLLCGDWPQEGISGVFNRSCGITYTQYRNIFPIWALGRCYETYGEKLEG